MHLALKSYSATTCHRKSVHVDSTNPSKAWTTFTLLPLKQFRCDVTVFQNAVAQQITVEHLHNLAKYYHLPCQNSNLEYSGLAHWCVWLVQGVRRGGEPNLRW